MLTSLLAGGLAAAAIAVALTLVLIHALRSRGVMDVPNARSSHAVPTPRGGGLAIVLGALAGTLVQVWTGGAAPSALFCLAVLGIATLSFADDVLGLPVVVRLFLQGGCAALLLSSGCALTRLPLPAPFDVPLGDVSGWCVSWLWIMGVTNIYNFLDGIDGLAAVQGFVACAGLAFMEVGPAISGVNVAAAGGCAGFLVYNWHPGKIFMGDIGSTALGFLIAASPLQAAAESRHTAVLATALCVWFFLSDGAYTLGRRLVNGERVWQAHRTHLYQLWVAAGYGHDYVVMRVGAAAVVLAAGATIAYRISSSPMLWAVLCIGLLAFLLYRSKVGQLGGRSATDVL